MTRPYRFSISSALVLATLLSACATMPSTPTHQPAEMLSEGEIELSVGGTFSTNISARIFEFGFVSDFPQWQASPSFEAQGELRMAIAEGIEFQVPVLFSLMATVEPVDFDDVPVAGSWMTADALFKFGMPAVEPKPGEPFEGATAFMVGPGVAMLLHPLLTVPAPTFNLSVHWLTDFASQDPNQTVTFGISYRYKQLVFDYPSDRNVAQFMFHSAMLHLGQNLNRIDGVPWRWRLSLGLTYDGYTWFEDELGLPVVLGFGVSFPFALR